MSVHVDYTRPGVVRWWEKPPSNTLEVIAAPTLEPTSSWLREDCLAPGFSGEGRCLEFAEPGRGLCVEHLRQALA